MTRLYRMYLLWRLEPLLVEEAGLEARIEAEGRSGYVVPFCEEQLARTKVKIKALRAKLFPETQEAPS